MAMLRRVAERAIRMHKQYREDQAQRIIAALAKSLEKGSKKAQTGNN